MGTYQKTCTWNGNGAGGYVTLALQDLDSFEGGKRTAELAPGRVSLTVLPGVGDGAYEEHRALEKTLAEQALARL